MILSQNFNEVEYVHYVYYESKIKYTYYHIHYVLYVYKIIPQIRLSALYFYTTKLYVT